MSVYPDPSAFVSSDLVSNRGSESRSATSQALALNLLGRGVEYLLQSQLASTPLTNDEREAVRILHRLQRLVFEDYARSFWSSTGETCC
jgi:ribosomal 50S subunit-associated protein YjgA (DUF615 family)